MSLREIVEAGAGCGKTTGLVDRYVAALGLHQDPALKARYSPSSERLIHASEILALTFTNEAARQMQERILKRLTHDGYTLEARTVREESQISTYHSFCLKLLQPHLVKRGFEGPLLSPVLAETLRREYLIRALSEYPDSHAVRRVLSLPRILSTGTRLWFHPLDRNPVEDMRKTYAEKTRIFEEFRERLLVDAESLARQVTAREKKPNPEAWAYSLVEALRNPTPEAFAKISFGKGPKWQKNDNLDVHERAENIRDFFKGGHAAFLYPDTRDEEFAAQEAVWKFLKWALPRKPKIFDFEAAEQELLQLLRDSEPLRLIPAPRLILVDEFQDTNEVQYEILRRISDENTQWYFVGDPKQSIYAFRGGDVSLFYRLRNELERKNLDTNYRSHTRILELVNRVQPAIFRPEDNIHDPEPQILRWPEGKDPGELGLHWLEAKDSTLDYTAKLLLSRRDHFEKTSTAVLFRSWSKLYEFADILRSSGVLFRIAGSENPFDHILTDLFCSYLISQENPENMQGFWGLERWHDSTRFSWSEVADGEELRRKHVIPERGWSASFQRFCEEIQVTRFENSASWVAPMERWIKHQVAEGLASRLTRTQLAHWIQANRAKIESDNPYKITPDDPSQPGLTLLTLHGSKGLEFRHVYLPELFERVSAQQEGSLEGDDGDVLLKIALKKERGVARRSLAYDLRKIDKLQAEYAEQKRLLYVALTRAIEGLHVIGHVAGEEKKKSEPLAVLGVPRARPEYWNHALQAIALEGVAETRFVESSVDGNGENAKDPKVWIYPRPFVPVNPATESFHRCGVSKYLQLSSESEEDEERASAKELKHGRASFDFAAQNDVGTDFHALLELWNGDVAKLDSLLDPLKPELRRPLKAAALELRALPELADYWRTLATRPDFVQREFGLFLISPEYRLSGFADAIWFRSPEEICLIDWKSGASLKRLQSAERLEKFRRQLQLYARGFGKSFARIRLEVYGIELGATPRAARILSEYFPLT